MNKFFERKSSAVQISNGEGTKTKSIPKSTAKNKRNKPKTSKTTPKRKEKI